MLALYKEGGELALGDVTRPVLRPGEVLVRVAVAGVCRTDLDVAAGNIAIAESLILGHEFSGWIEAVGSDVTQISRGSRVAVFPQFDCGTCAGCAEGVPCWTPDILGLTRHGAFAEFVAVPATSVVEAAPTTTLAHLAYAEPVAAALGAVPWQLPRDARGAVVGDNRIAHLTALMLKHAGFAQVSVLAEPSLIDVAGNVFDFAVEARATEHVMAHIVRIVRPAGLVLLKSRSAAPCAVPLGEVVRKQQCLSGVLYGSFEQAVALIDDGQLDLDAFMAPARPLVEYRAVFAEARQSETLKQMFSIAKV